MNRLHLAILGLLIAPLAAQAPNRFVPQDAQLVLRLAAPAKWKSQFEDTKIAQVFAGQALAPMMEQIKQGFTGGNEAEELGIDPEVLEGLWNEYTGDIVAAIHLDLEDIGDAIVEDRTPSMAMVISMSPDGSFDLAGFAEQIADALERHTDDELVDIEVGDLTLRCNVESDGAASLPTMVDDHLVMVWATDMEQSGPRMIAADARRDDVGAGKPLFLHVDAEQGIQTLMSVVGAEMENNPAAPPIDINQVLVDMGFTCLKTFELSIAADGKQMVVESNLETKADDHGLFGVFLVDQQMPRLLRYLPASADAFTCQAFDLGAIYTTIGNMWAGFDMFVPMSFDDIEAAFEESTKVRLREDIIDQIGTEMLSLVDFSAGEDLDPDDLGAFFAGSCYAFSLKDGKAFGESLEKALRSRGLHAARKSEDYQGIKVYRLRVAGAFEIEYAVTDDLFLIAPGGDEASRGQLRSILDARANPQAGMHELVARYQDLVPAGWNGVGITPLADLFSNLGGVMAEAATRDLPPEAGMIFGLMSQVGAEMKQVGLDNAVQFSWSSPTGMRSVLRL